MDTKEFILSSIKVHGDKYDYSQAEYTKRKGKVTIRCKKHGFVFEQIAGNHLNGSGCPKCGKERQVKHVQSRARSAAQFIAEVTAKHGGKFTYVDVPDPCTTLSQVTVKCPDHGEFTQQAKVHLNGHGCPRCGVEAAASTSTLDPAEIMEGFIKDHPTLEFRSVYTRMNDPLTAYCPKHKYEFTRRAQHFTERGCPKCGLERAGKNHVSGLKGIAVYNERRRVESKQQFKDWVSNVYEGNLTFDLTTYTKLSNPIKSFCPKHGEITSIPLNLMKGHGCVQCGHEQAGPKTSFSYFMDRVAERFPNTKFEYDKGSFRSMGKPMRIKCPDHGWMDMTPKNHLNYNNGCNKCGANTSQYEGIIGGFVEDLGFEVRYNVRDILPMKYGGVSEIDVYVPEHKVGIEFHGLVWHTTDPNLELSEYRKLTLAKDEQEDCSRRLRYKSLDKLERAEEVGVRLIQIFQDEWRDKQSAVEGRIKAILGVAERRHARELTLVEASTDYQIERCKKFIEWVHTQGDRHAAIRFMLVDGEGCIRMAATFSKAPRHAEYELIRLASDGLVVGGFSRLLKAFERKYNPKSIMSYCDLRYGRGGGYEAVGFTKVGVTEPDWWWLPDNNSRHRVPRQDTMRARLHKHPQLAKAVADNPDQSIESVAYSIGWRKMFGTGSAIYVKEVDPTPET